ncbi:MAG: hypothetical protein EOO88_42380, partial [Pedobacter sp.]
MIVSKYEKDGVLLLAGENDYIRFEIAPSLGGKLTSVYNKELKKEFLWHNNQLALSINNQGADYDENFWGGIDELLPNDIPEKVDGIGYPDHGELWTTQLQYEINEDRILVFGRLEKSGLYYSKSIALQADSPKIKLSYCLRNESEFTRHFLWKLHAALKIERGDRLISNAKKAKVVYPESSRFSLSEEFEWPMVEGVDAAIVPEKDMTMDFFYLYEASEGKMGLLSENGNHLFLYEYDQRIFPFQWYFASYGKFRDHYTAILEPASAMPVSVNEAAEKQQCSVLKPAQEIN